MLELIKHDEYLHPYESEIVQRHQSYLKKMHIYTHGTSSVKDYSLGHLYFGLHSDNKEYIFREWAPNATAIYLKGDFNNWNIDEQYAFQDIGKGNWELRIEKKHITEGQCYKLEIRWNNGKGDRIPAYARCVTQDNNTKLFAAKITTSDTYRWKYETPTPSKSPFIYEAHIGMSSEKENVSSFNEFRENTLPYIHQLGYNTIQLMAIQEHPYYGSFGYHVSSFFAPSSRFGSADELKKLIDEAHGLGISVIMDIVHSHAVKNEEEGLGKYDGSSSQFFYEDHRREHPAWDSLCFDYGKDEVIHFLLSNLRYWLDDFHFDGFRFDGVTSMIYLHHGLEKDFTQYKDYYNGEQNIDAIIYLTLANKLIHEINPHAISIAEEMSGIPGLAFPIQGGGIGFDFRMAMGIPDFWIKTIKENRDEKWRVGHIFHELTNKRPEEKVISYVESHDQALVGDKTIFFRLVDKEIYSHMQKNDSNIIIDRGISLHKIIRLITMATSGGGYLNFMGNEFGHPEWIDFPREGNQWSYKYARRQWSLVFSSQLKYQYLYRFDKEALYLLKEFETLQYPQIQKIWDNQNDQILSFLRGNLLFVFNFNPTHSFTDYKMNAPAAKYKLLLSSEETRFGGNGIVDKSVRYITNLNNGDYTLQLYIPSRTALVFQVQKSKAVH